MSRESSWGQRARKAGQYLGQGNLSGLAAELRRYRAWRRAKGRHVPHEATAQRAAEATFWDQCDLDLVRRVSWTSAADFGYWVFQEGCQGRFADVMDLVVDAMAVPQSQDLYGLVLGCGDMAAEHGMFLHPKLKFTEIDAFDVSPESIEKAKRLTDEKGLKVNYWVADANDIELPANRYALGVTMHAFHHFERIEHVTRQINRSLVPGGVFYTVDYIGPRRLQFTESQLAYAQLMLEALPARYRRELDGSIRQRVASVPLDAISPDEAIRSDQILPAMACHMRVVWQENWAGLLYPLLEGLGLNFDPDNCEDQALVTFLYNLDRVLCQAGKVEPNYTITLATKK